LSGFDRCRAESHGGVAATAPRQGTGTPRITRDEWRRATLWRTQTADDQTEADDTVANDHDRREYRIAGQRIRSLPAREHQRNDQRHFDHCHGDREHERPVGFADPMRDDLCMMDRRKNGEQQHGRQQQAEGPTPKTEPWPSASTSSARNGPNVLHGGNADARLDWGERSSFVGAARMIESSIGDRHARSSLVRARLGEKLPAAGDGDCRTQRYNVDLWFVQLLLLLTCPIFPSCRKLTPYRNPRPCRRRKRPFEFSARSVSRTWSTTWCSR